MKRRSVPAWVPALLVWVLLMLATQGARAGDQLSPVPDDTSDDALFAAATLALHEGRPSDAIADLEALGDRGVIDPAVSLDRGLAYAERIRAGGEQPGDLGRAAQGFEEARDLSSDATLTDDAARALALVRAEVARRRAHAGEPAALDQGASLGHTIVHLLAENTWAVMAAIASGLFAAGLFVRRIADARRARIGATLVCSVAAPLLVLTALAAVVARDDRLHLREGVIVTAAARPSDERGIVRPGASTLPEAARVQVVESKAGWTRVRWGSLDAWVPAQSPAPMHHVRQTKQGLLATGVPQRDLASAHRRTHL